MQGLLPSYLQTYQNAFSERTYIIRSTTQNEFKPISARTKLFENSFFPYCIKEWSQLNDKFRNIKSINKFKVTILNFIRLKGNSVFDIQHTSGITLLSHLRLNLSHLNEHKFRNNFNHTVDPMCTSGVEPETTLHYLIRCNLSSTQRLELLDNVCVLNQSLKN